MWNIEYQKARVTPVWGGERTEERERKMQLSLFKRRFFILRRWEENRGDGAKKDPIQQREKQDLFETRKGRGGMMISRKKERMTKNGKLGDKSLAVHSRNGGKF